MIQRGRARKSEVASLISPIDGYRGILKKKGLKPRDHIKENTKKIIETQKEFKMKEKSWNSNAKIRKLKQFKGVNSRVYNYSKRPQTSIGAKSQTSKEKVRMESPDPFNENINTENIQTNELPGKEQNFIKKNIIKAWKRKEVNELERPKTASEYGTETYKRENIEPHIPNKGKVPSYLINRKKEWRIEEENKQKEIEQRKNPPGTKLLPEAERLTTLDQLLASRTEMINTLETLPITLRTMALRNRKSELESKLKETDWAISLFSRENVYIPI